MTQFDASALTVLWERSAVSTAGDQTHLLISIKTPERQSSLPAAPVDVAFALDRSGSMSGEPIQLVKKAVDVAASLLADRDRVALVVYDNVIDVIHPLQAATATSRNQLRTALNAIDARGSTNLSEGWMTACLQLADSVAPAECKPRLCRTMLLTDGLANNGITDPSQLAVHATNLRQRGISTSTLGVGEHFDEVLLAGMAEAGGGNFQFIPTSAELPAFFQSELGRLLATVASNVMLTLTLSAGMGARVVSTFPAKVQGQQIIAELGDLPENDEQALLVKFDTPPATVGTLMTIGIALSWTDVATGVNHRTELSAAPLATAANGSPLLEERNETVAEQVALQQAAVNQREAMRLDRAGRYAESRHAHRQAAQALAAAPQTNLIKSRFSEANAFALFADDSAMPEFVRKQAVHDNYRRGRGRSDER